MGRRSAGRRIHGDHVEASRRPKTQGTAIVPGFPVMTARVQIPVRGSAGRRIHGDHVEAARRPKTQLTAIVPGVHGTARWNVAYGRPARVATASSARTVSESRR